MISDEREFRGYYNDRRQKDRDGDDRNFSSDRYDREYDYSTGYNRSRDYGSHAYDRRSHNGGDRYDNRDYRYNYGDQGAHDRYRNERSRDSGSSRDEGYWESDDRRNRGNRNPYERETGYHGANYENPNNSDRYRSRGGNEEARQYRAQRPQWDPEDVNRRSQYDLGMGHYQARDRQESLYGGITEKHNRRNNHSGGSSDDRGFFERTTDRFSNQVPNRIRSWFRDEDQDRDRNRGNRDRYDRDRY